VACAPRDCLLRLRFSRKSKPSGGAGDDEIVFAQVGRYFGRLVAVSSMWTLDVRVQFCNSNADGDANLSYSHRWCCVYCSSKLCKDTGQGGRVESVPRCHTLSIEGHVNIKSTERGRSVGHRGVPRSGVRGLEDLGSLLRSALSLYRFCQLARRAVENENLGHVLKIDLMDRTHRAVAVRTSWRCRECGHGQVALGGGDQTVSWGGCALAPSRPRPTRAQRSRLCLQTHTRRLGTTTRFGCGGPENAQTILAR
jgi:hypothetical protein